MKKIYFLFSVLALLISGCSQELNETLAGDHEITSIHVSTKDFAGSTRTAINDSYAVAWRESDVIGIFPMEEKSKQIAFEISAGANSQNATFDGSGWGLKSNTEYAAYYPCNGNTYQDKSSIVLDYSGQKQVGNNPTGHLGDYDYLKTLSTAPCDGTLNLQFEHIGALISYDLQADRSASYDYNKVELQTDGYFYSRGILNLETGEVRPDEESKTQTLTLELDNPTQTLKRLIRIHMMIFPVNLEGHNITFHLYDIDGNIRGSFTIKGKNFLPGTQWNEDTLTFVRFPYLTFKAEKLQTLSITDAHESIEFSYGDEDWHPIDILPVVPFGGTLGDLRLRGKCTNGTGREGYYSIIKFGNDTPVACSGDIRTLVDYENYRSISTEKVSFYNLFRDCTVLTSAPDLPATTLAGACYSHMFAGCTSLVKAPRLPATTLSDECYQRMFMGCTSLTEAPVLPAKKVLNFSYAGMFRGCTSLTTAPELPANTLGRYCYNSMFYECTSLTTAPELPATVMKDYCYESMFSGCTSLVKAPKLPAYTLAADCYDSMFEGCTSLTQAPELPATDLEGRCYENMFYRCTSLTEAPQLPATTLKDWCYYNMFAGCTSLTIAPELPATELARWCYSKMFSGCTNLNWIKMMATDISATNCLSSWTYRVPSTGTFVKNAAATWNVSGSDGIPEGWTVETATK